MATETMKSGTAAGMEEFQATPYYQGLGIEQLKAQLGGYQTDDAALRQQAEAQYRPTYDAEVESIRHQLQQQVQGYNSQLAGMGSAYERQRRNTNQAYDESAVDLNNALTKRGLGRSSLVSTQGAYLENKRNQALADIDRDETSAIQAINEKIALLTDQAAGREQTLAGNYARQLEQRVNELKDKNRTAAVSLQLQIAALQQKGYEAYQDWLMENRKQELKEQELMAKYPELFGGESGGFSPGGGSGAKGGVSGKTNKQSVAGGALVKMLDTVKSALSGGKGSAKSSAKAQKPDIQTVKAQKAKTGKQPVGRR